MPLLSHLGAVSLTFWRRRDSKVSSFWKFNGQTPLPSRFHPFFSLSPKSEKSFNSASWGDTVWGSPARRTRRNKGVGGHCPVSHRNEVKLIQLQRRSEPLSFMKISVQMIVKIRAFHTPAPASPEISIWSGVESGSYI